MFKKKRTLLVLCISILYAIGVLGGVYVSRKDMHLTEKNTIEYTAKVVDIKTWIASEDVYIGIVTEEYDAALTVALAISNQKGQNFLSDISAGEIITFRIQERMKDSLESKHMAIAVALRTAEHNYYSLETYNEIMQASGVSSTSAAICLSCFALIVAVCCAFRLTGSRPFRSKKGKE